MRSTAEINLKAPKGGFFRALALIWLISLICPLPALARDAGWARPINVPYADNFYQVSPDLYRAAQPTAQAFREYEKLGIKTVINLRDKHSDVSLIRGTRLKLIEVPLETWDIDDDDVITVMRLIKDQPKPILIHCRHGADRTGLMVAMYRIVFEGWRREHALRELREGGFGFHKIWVNIPKYVKNVDEAKIKAAVFGASAEAR